MFSMLKSSLFFTLAASMLAGATFQVARDSDALFEVQAGRIYIGWKGLQQGSTVEPRVSGGGDLGKVFYATDSTDLAKTFAIPGDKYVCTIDVDATAWNKLQKVWVPIDVYEANKANNKMDKQYPGVDVLFAYHGDGLIPGEGGTDQCPWQLGIREKALKTLDLKGACVLKSKLKKGILDYPAETSSWGIQLTPSRPPNDPPAAKCERKNRL